MFGALALGLHNRQVLYLTIMSKFRSRRWPWISLIGRSSYMPVEQHIFVKALALGLPNRECLNVTLISTFR